MTLKQCKREEEFLRADVLASKLRDGKVVSFWSDVFHVAGRGKKLPHSIHHTSSDKEVSQFWKRKYQGIHNSVNHESYRDELKILVSNMSRSSVKLTSPERICIASKELANNKSCGLDGIPSEVFKYALMVVWLWMASLIKMMRVHSYVPNAITDVKIMPVLKSSTRTSIGSGNNQPIAVLKSASKVVEKVLLGWLM